MQFQYLKCLSLSLFSAQKLHPERNVLLHVTAAQIQVLSFLLFFLSNDFTESRKNLTCWHQQNVSTPTLPPPRQHKSSPGPQYLSAHHQDSQALPPSVPLWGTGSLDCVCITHHKIDLSELSPHATSGNQPLLERMLIQRYNPGLRGELPCSLRSRRSPKGLSKNLVTDFWRKVSLSY